MMKKKCMSVLLALCLALALLPTALAADTLPITWLPAGMEVRAYLESSDQFLVSANEGLNWSIVDWNGNVVKDLGNTGYDSVFDVLYFEDGLADVSKGWKHGFINETGEVVIPLVYDAAGSFSDGLAPVLTGDWGTGKWGYINERGQLVIAQEYDYAYDFSEGLAIVDKNGKKGYIDTTGKTVIPLVYDEALPFYNGAAVVRVGDWETGKYGLIDKTGQMIVPMEYDYIYGWGEGLLTVTKDGKMGLMDTTGKMVIPMIYDDYMEADTGHGVCTNGFIALYDASGDTIYVNESNQMVGQYDFGREFSDGMAYIEQDGRSGFINTTGEVAFYLNPPAGKEVLPSGLYGPRFQDGLCAVTIIETPAADDAYDHLLTGVVNKAGELVLPYEYRYITVLGPVGWVEGTDGRYGLFRNPYAASQPAPVEPTQPEQPAQPVQPAAPAAATPTASTVLVNGTNTAFDAYNIGGANYFKLRDLAFVLNGTGKQFEVSWDGAANAISLISGQPYTAVGGEMTAGTGMAQTATPTSSKILLNGAEVALEAYNIGGNNYFKLRDLGSAFDFGVDWDGAANTVVIDTSKGYTPG